ncbi:Transcription factor tau subunit [Candida viswanathii]|uniref:Transcription factor tau subunit n=1 Tax=Candida viswanathii TaxID=5486 RepID=A0A367YL23_9ASCO|nr:Transcription factor tau subunit [Candida viswanathii]
MTIETIYIARHGFRSNWLPPPHPEPPTGIDSDPQLAPHGVEQAKQLAAYLTSLPAKDKPQFIIASPFYRCVETAEPIAEMLDLKVAIDRGVGEWFRTNRSTKPVPADYDQLKKFFGTVLIDEVKWPRDNLNVIPSLEGESEEEIFERAQAFWKSFIPAFEEKYPDIDTILIVTHAATKIALGSALLGLTSVFDYIDDNQTLLRAGACSLSKYVRSDKQAGANWEIVMNGNCEFLTKGEEMNWDFREGVEAGSAEDIAKRKAAEEALAGQQQQNTDAPITDLATGSEVDGNDEDFETFYVTIDLPPSNIKGDNDEDTLLRPGQAPKSKNTVIKPSAQLQFTDLKEDHPLIKISNNVSQKTATHGTQSRSRVIDNSLLIDRRIFETNWNRLQGTELVFDENGKFIGSIKEHLICNKNTSFVLKEQGEAVDAEELGDIDDENVNQHALQPEQVQQLRTQFLKKAILKARKKNPEAKST